MESKHAKEWASRLVMGDRLTHSDELEMLAWFEQHHEDRDAYLVDEAVDSLLGCFARLRSTEDDFVAATLRRVAERSKYESKELAGGTVAVNVRDLPADDRIVADTGSKCGDGRGKGRNARFRMAGLLCASLLLIIVLGGFLLFRHDRMLNADRGRRNDGQRPSAIPSAFARLDGAGGAVWDTPRVAGERLGAGTLKLLHGAAVIRFDKGTTASVTGPAVVDLRSPDEMLLHCGRLAVLVPPPATGFTVTTPVGRVVDLGTEFDVSVDNTGTTETRVRLGKVSFLPQRQGELPGNSIELSADGLNRAVSAVPDIAAPVLPVCTQVSGSQGMFVGTICANGKTIEFTSREGFEESRTFVMKQLREAPNDFRENWSIMVQASGRGTASASVSGGGSFGTGNQDSSGSSQRHVSFSENGKTISITQDKSGITVATVEMIDGKEEKTEVKSANPQELKQKNPAAYRLYLQYLDRVEDGIRENAPRPPDAREMLRAQLLEQKRNAADNPQMRELLDKMLRQVDEEN